MIGLLSWTTFGTWLPGPARGCVDRGAVQIDQPLPKPDEALSANRRRSLRWPAVRLDEAARAAILEDLPRVARLRRFQVHVLVIAADHVHLVIEFDDDDRDVDRLIQLIKGALSRKLSVAAGDEPARSTRDHRLPYHKWWTRQHSFRIIRDAEAFDNVREQLLDHRGEEVTIQIDPRDNCH
jgi:REP element-mobilizing transposase RayT